MFLDDRSSRGGLAPWLARHPGGGPEGGKPGVVQSVMVEAQECPSPAMEKPFDFDRPE